MRQRYRSIALLTVGCAIPSLSVGAAAQTRGSLPSPYADPQTSVLLASELLAVDSANVELHLVVARESTALGMLAPTKEERIAWLDGAREAAAAAFALDSTSAEVNYWVAASVGLRADEEGGRSKVSFAREAHARILRTLELDSLHAGANHVLGRLHAGARRLGWLNRLFARTLGLGEILDAATWEGAERHMRIAAERDPGQLVHLYELGRLLVEHGSSPEEGRAILEDVASREPRHALDSLFIARAAAALSDFADR